MCRTWSSRRHCSRRFDPFSATRHDSFARPEEVVTCELCRAFVSCCYANVRRIGAAVHCDATKIRYLNQISVSTREGWIDGDGAKEIELTERQLHELIDRLRDFAGVEGN
jgi:hypothetical protein